jgi:RecJ-like exonuclease
VVYLIKLLVHGDSDGVCSGALLKAYLGRKGDVAVYFTNPAGLAKDLEEFTRQGDDIYIADIALDEKTYSQVLDILEKRGLEGKVVYIDHHPLPDDFKQPGNVEFVHDTCCSASELVFKYVEKHLDPDYSRIGLYGAIADYIDETPWVRDQLTRWDRRFVYYEAGVLVQGLEHTGRQYDFKREVLTALSSNSLPSSISDLASRAIKQSMLDEDLRLSVKRTVYNKGVVSIVENPPGSVGRAANYARIYGGGLIGLAFETRGRMLVMSLRSDKVDLNKLIRTISRELDIQGGGHPYAAGARLGIEAFDKFVEKINSSYGKFLRA